MRGDAAPLRTPSTVGGGYDKTLLPNPQLPHLATPPLPMSTSKSIRRMRSVQDSVLPEGRGGEASPHIPLIHRAKPG